MKQTIRQVISGVFGVVALAGMVAMAPMQDPEDLAVKCPQVCRGLTSSDVMWWVHGCYSLPPQCVAGGGADPSMESRTRTQPTAPKRGATSGRRPLLVMRGAR